MFGVPRGALFAVLMTGAVLVPAAAAPAPVIGTRVTEIVSPPGGAPPAGGPSGDATYAQDTGVARDDPTGGPRPADHEVTFSQDNRKVRYVAYDSSASNLVAGDVNGKRDVIVMKRKAPGTGQITGSLSLGSVSSSGEQGNGDSIKPSLDGLSTLGQDAVAPHCLTFQSQATNLSPADTTSDWDVYLHDLDSGRTTLVSKGTENATDGVVDGYCHRVSFAAGGRVWVYDVAQGTARRVGRGSHPDLQTNGEGVAFDRGGQVYYQPLSDHREKVGRSGGRQLVSNSATHARRGGNGVSSDPNLDNDGVYVVFESTATDLCLSRCRGISEDRNGATRDVFRRTLRQSPSGGPDEMEMVSYDAGTDTQGDLQSDQVHVSGHGEQAVFRSFAKNLRDLKFDGPPSDGPFMHVYFWNFPRERGAGSLSGESKCCRTGEFHLADGRPAFSWSPAISNRGTFVGFTSREENESGEANGQAVADAFVRFMGLSDE